MERMVLSSRSNNCTYQDEEITCETPTNEYPMINFPEHTKEWTYTMRRSMQEVVDGLFLGPYSAATRNSLQFLIDSGITHIVCVRQNIEAHFIKPNFPEYFKYLVLDIADSNTENIIQHFKRVKAFIDECLNARGRVLVHGNAGISRSAALVLAYLMETYGLTQAKAYEILQQKRFCINPNDGFMAQLREYEPIYQAQKTYKTLPLTTNRPPLKRSIFVSDPECYDEQKAEPMDS